MRKGRLLDPARPQRTRLDRSRKQEKRTAESAGGRVTPGSGNQWHAKGDVTTKTALIENKDRTESNQYILTKKEMRLLRRRAFKAGKMPVLQIDFGKEQYVVLTIDDAKDFGVPC